MTDKHHSDMKTLNDHISDMLTKLTKTSSKTDKQEEELREISSNLSTYEDRLDTLILKETQIQTLSLQITEISSKLSAYEDRLDKLNIANINKFETVMKEHEEILNSKIDTDIGDLKAEATSSTNQKFYTLNSQKSNSSSNQPSSDINKWTLLKSSYFHSHASQFTKNLSQRTLEGNTLPKIQK